MNTTDIGKLHHDICALVRVGLADGAGAEVSETTRARACCDSHQITMRTGREGDGSNTISDAMRRRVFARSPGGLRYERLPQCLGCSLGSHRPSYQP
jgi:hypothetical protein